MIFESSDSQLFDLTQSFSSVSVRAILELVNTDASGQTSGTGTLNGGTKAKKLSVSARVKFDDASALTSLIKMAEAVDSEGRRIVYTIVESAAEALDIRQVIFHDRLEVNKANQINAWDISFTLLEYRSVPEMIEDRSNPTNSVGNGVNGETLGPEIASLEKGGVVHDMLKKIDNYLSSVEILK